MLTYKFHKKCNYKHIQLYIVYMQNAKTTPLLDPSGDITCGV